MYQCIDLPFSLANAAQLFMKLLAQASSHVHFRTTSVYPSIDNIFHAQDSESKALGRCEHLSSSSAGVYTKPSEVLSCFLARC